MRTRSFSKAVPSFSGAAFVAGLAIACAVLLGLSIAPQTALALDDAQRYYGTTAAETSVSVSKTAFPDGANAVVLARADDYFDAMSGSGLAGTLNAPILLTTKESLDDATKEEIGRLKATTVYLVGGTAVISDAVEQQVKSLKVTTKRLAGTAACDTSVACAEEIKALKGNTKNEAIIATSASFMDACSMSSYAYKYKVPLIIETSDLQLCDTSVPFMESATRILVAGGTAAVPAANAEDRWSTKVLRMGGTDGYETSQKIAETFCAEGSLSNEVIGFATGELASKGVDALAASSLCALNNAPVLLVNKEGNSCTVNNYLVSNQGAVSSELVFGGTAVIPDQVYDYTRKIVTNAITYTAIIGSDKWYPDGYATHLEGSDLQMLMCADSEARKIWLISVPRDTYYESGFKFNGYNVRKSNYVYSMTYNQAITDEYDDATAEAMGSRAMCDMLSSLFGVSVDHYAQTDLTRFISLIDSFGGLNTYVPFTIDYDFYSMYNTTTGVIQPPFSAIRFNEGTYTPMSGFNVSALSRARTSNFTDLDYSHYGLEQDATRQSINRRVMSSLIDKAFCTGNAATFTQQLINAGYIHTDLCESEIQSLMGAFQSTHDFTIYGSSTPVQGGIIQFPDDAPYLINQDPQFYQNLMDSVRTGADTGWANGLYGVKQYNHFPICSTTKVKW